MALPSSLQDFCSDAFFQLAHGPDPVPARIAPNNRIVFRPIPEVEAVLPAFGAVEFNPHAARHYADWSILFRWQHCPLKRVKSDVAGDVITNMKARAEQCRRLARATHDPRALKILNDMADDIEADIKRLEAGGRPLSSAQDPRPI
jgi:hypothetical protein